MLLCWGQQHERESNQHYVRWFKVSMHWISCRPCVDHLIPRYRVLRTRIVFIEYLILGRGMEGSKQIQKIFFVHTTWNLLTSSRGLRLGTLGHNYGATRKHELCSRSGQVQNRSCRRSRSKVLRGSVAVLSAVSQLSASVSCQRLSAEVAVCFRSVWLGQGSVRRWRYKLFQTSLGLN